jgi:RNA polymerase sigma-70 factor, ECF subfamily
MASSRGPEQGEDRPPDADTRRERFESLALPLMQPLYDTALRLTADGDEAADVVQETYLRAFRTFDNFRPGTNARAWLFTVLYSVAINRRKKSLREVRTPSAEELEERFRLRVEAPEIETIGQVEAWGARWPTEIEAALRELPEVFRAAVLLVDVQELTYEEAAQALDCPVGTAQSRVFRGRRMLCGILEDYARRSGYPTRTER